MPGMHMLMDLNREEEDRILRVQYREPVGQVGGDWYIKPIPGGMTSGRGALHVWIPGTYKRKDVLVYAQTSVESWMQATAAIRAKFQDQMDEVGWAILPDSVRDALRPRYVEALRRVLSTKLQNVSKDELEAIANMFMDALTAGSPEEFHQ